MGLRVLLVEDDPELRETTAMVLEHHGFAVVTAADGVAALAALEREAIDAAVIDIVLPRLDGLALTHRIRERSPLPIVLLTARDLPHDQVVGLDAGADDYIIKPFDGPVLAARLRAVVRRAGGGPAEQGPLRRGDLAIDLAGMAVTRAGSPVDLTATEFRLLAALLEDHGTVLSRERLLERVWGDADWGDARVVDVNVQRLRAKIGAGHIVTVCGVGYKMPRVDG